MRLKTNGDIAAKIPLQPLKMFFIGLVKGLNLKMGKLQNMVSLSDPVETEN